MSKTRDTGYLANVIQVHDTGVRIMSGSTMLMAVSSSGAVTITGEISGSDAANALLLSGTGSVGFTTTSSFLAVSSSQQQVSASYIALSASYNTFSGSASTRITANSSSIQQVSSSQQQISSSLLNVISVFATTGSNSFRADQSITGSLVVSSTITAQTLVVQTVTSSIVYSSGSNIFGCDLNSRQTFTGSVLITGSLTIAGASSATSYSGATIYGSTAVCSAVGKFTSCIDAGSGTFSGGVTVTQDINSLYGIAAARNGSNTQASGPYFLLSNAAYNQLWYQQLNASNGLDTWYNGSIKLTIASTGAATFACQVNAESFYTNDTRYISNQIMSGYNANSEDSDIWINYTGYLGGTTRFRDFRIGNGKQGQIALFDGSTGAASFACSVGIGTTLAVTGTTSLSCRLSIGASDQSYASVFIGGALTTGTNQWAIITDPQLSGTDSSYALYANARIKASTAVTNAFGVYIPSAEKLSGATITNNYALYIANQTSGATLNYSIYSSGGANYFGGCVGIGTGSPNSRLEVQKTTAQAPGIFINQCSSDEATIRFKSTHSCMSDFRIGASILVGSAFEIYNVQCNKTNYMVNCNGFSKISNDGTFVNGNNTSYHSMNSSGDLTLYAYNTNATGNGILSNVQSCNTSYYSFRGFSDPYGDMAFIYSNGTFGSRTGTYGGIISDARCKTEICDASSQWSDIKNLRVRNFKLIEDVENDPTNALRQIGFIAQEVETVSPGLVFESGNGCVDSGCWKNVKTSIIHTKAVKALQEAMCRIEILESCLGIS